MLLTKHASLSLWSMTTILLRKTNKHCPVTKEARDALNTAVLNAYEVKLQQNQSSQIDIVPAQNSQDIGDISEFEEYP